MRLNLGQWIIHKIGSWLSRDRPATKGYLSNFEAIHRTIKPCDVLLIEGRNQTSDIIRRITLSPWSHAMLYIGHFDDIDDLVLQARIREQLDPQPSDQLVIESILGRGTVVSYLSDYKDDHVRICRPEGLSYTDSRKICRFAIEHLGTLYSIRHILDLARFFIPWHIIPHKWGSSLFNFHPGPAAQDICSSMIARAFQSVQFPILPLILPKNSSDKTRKPELEFIQRNPKLYTPKDFDYSPYFSIIKYPITPLPGEFESYKKLPWNDQQFSNDSAGLQELNNNDKN